MKPKKVKIELVFLDWKKVGKSIYNTAQGMDLSIGPFHSGTMFEGELKVSLEDMCYLEDALEKNVDAVFMVRLKQDKPKQPVARGAAESFVRRGRGTQHGRKV